MEERPTFPDVQGNERVVWSGAEEAYTYMVLVLGRKERIPQRFEIKEGGSEIFMCLQVRYGLRPKEDFARLLIWQLLMSKNDNHIWGAWREAYAKREQNFGQGTELTLEQRILAWIDGIPVLQPPTPPDTNGRVPVFVASDDFEGRVDYANGSRVASDLAAESETGLLRHFSASSEVTPWESRGIKETFGKIKGAVGKVLDKAKGKKP